MGKFKVTKAELEIIQVLLEQGPSTVRQVHNVVTAKREVGYTSTLKIMQVLQERGLLKRDTSSTAHVYDVAIAEEELQSSLLGDFVEEAFRGSAKKLVLQLLGQQHVTPDELQEIRAYLAAMEHKDEQ